MKMNQYPNWFSYGANSYFERNTSHFKDTPITALQIGAYTGDASLWMVENILTHKNSELYDVDTWAGSDESIHKEFNWSDIKEIYNNKLSTYIDSGKIIPTMMKSVDFLRMAPGPFDFVYIDGNHEAFAVVEDFIFVFDLVNINGIIAFDDYNWGSDLPAYKRPQMAINFILDVYQDKIKVIDSGNQMWIQKIAN